MGLTSEQVHWAGGMCFALVALALIVHAAAPTHLGWAPWLLPALLVGYGIESALDPLIHGRALPTHYGAEAAQHLVQGGAVLLAGAVEWARLRGRLRRAGWGLMTPAALLVLAGVFLVHAQHDASVSPAVLAVQHRAFAVILGVAAFARAATALVSGAAPLRAGWLFALLTFGLQLLAYTERTPPHGASAAAMGVGVKSVVTTHNPADATRSCDGGAGRLTRRQWASPALRSAGLTA